MFVRGSRYASAGTLTVTRRDGVTVVLTRIPDPRHPALRGFHRRIDGQRLDHIANRYLKDPDAFWRLCDASGTIASDALASRALIGIPSEED